MLAVTKEELCFLEEARLFFERNQEMASYRNEENSLIALRYTGEATRDSIMIFQIKYVAQFESVLEPAPALVLKERVE